MSALRSWYVVGMDDGVIRREATKAACLKWARKSAVASDRVLPGRHRTGDGFYQYRIGTSDDCKLVWIARGDAAQAQGFDLNQEPLYPYADRPYRRGDRTPETQEES